MRDPRPSDRAKRLRARLQELDITPREAARKANLPYTTLMNFLNGYSQSMRGSSEEKLSSALGTSIEDLFSGPTKSRSSLHPEQSGGVMPALGLLGTVERGAWRKRVPVKSIESTVHIAPNPKFPIEDQSVMVVRGSAFKPVASDGNSLIVLPIDKFPGGLYGLSIQSDEPLVVVETELNGRFEYQLMRLTHEAGTWSVASIQSNGADAETPPSQIVEGGPVQVSHAVIGITKFYL